MTVLFFDYWTKGINNVASIAHALNRDGIESKLLHLGSWRNSTISASETLDGVKCEDISVYSNDISTALDEIAPKVVVMFNTTSPIDRLIIRLCRSKAIKTIYLMHGITPVGKDLSEYINQENAKWSLYSRLKKASKYFSVFAAYLKSIMNDRFIEIFDIRAYGHFFHIALFPGEAHWRPWKYKDIYCDKALVYATIYQEEIVANIGYQEDRVSIVGNPNLDSVFNLINDPSAYLSAQKYLKRIGLSSDLKYILYIEDAFPENQVGGWTEETRVAELRDIALASKLAGYALIIKMHPASNMEYVQNEFSEHDGVYILSEARLPELTLVSRFVVGHNSTALLLPIIAGKPIIVPTWSPGLSGFGYFLANGVAHPAGSPEILQNIFSDPDINTKIKHDILKKYIDKFITYVDGNSNSRIVEEIRFFL